MTPEEIDNIMQDTPSQDSDFEEPHYTVLMSEEGDPVRNLPLFVARILVRELKKRSIMASIAVE